jgi:hypothetical protein
MTLPLFALLALLAAFAEPWLAAVVAVVRASVVRAVDLDVGTLDVAVGAVDVAGGGHR